MNRLALRPSERLLMRLYLHPVLFLEAAAGIALGTGLLVTGVLSHATGSIWLGVALLTVSVGWAILGLRAYAAGGIALTNQRVVYTAGWLRPRAVEIPLTEVSRTVAQRRGEVRELDPVRWLLRYVLDFGTVVLTTGDGATHSVRGLAHPHLVPQAIGSGLRETQLSTAVVSEREHRRAAIAAALLLSLLGIGAAVISADLHDRSQLVMVFLALGVLVEVAFWTARGGTTS